MNVIISSLLLFLTLMAVPSRGLASDSGRLYFGECRIWNEDFQLVRTLPGDICAPLPDGSWVRINSDGLAKYSSEGEPIWKLPGIYHHQLESDPSDDSFLVLGRTRTHFANLTTGADRVIKVSQMGKEILDWALIKSIQALDEIGKKTRRSARGHVSWAIPRVAQAAVLYKGVDLELSHINAVYRIPVSQRKSTGNGHYLVTDALKSLCFALDAEFKLTGWAFRPLVSPKQDFPPTVHDCQLLDDGSVVYFENFSSSGVYPSYRVLRVREGNIVFSFPTRREDYLAAATRGSVQVVPEGYLISASSDNDGGVIGIVSPAGEWLKKSKIDYPLQEIKVVPFHDFLKKNSLR